MIRFTSRQKKYFGCFIVLLAIMAASFYFYVLATAPNLNIGNLAGDHKEELSKLAKQADFWGGTAFLAQFTWLFSLSLMASSVALVGLVLGYIYSYFCCRQAKRLIDDLLLSLPAMPDEIFIKELKDRGIFIEDGVLTISRRYFRHASVDVLAHAIGHLLYLNSRDNLDLWLSADDTVFDQLAKLLIANYDEGSIDDFVQAMKGEKTVLGELAEVAVTLLDLNNQKLELEINIAYIKERRQSALCKAQNELAVKLDRVQKVVPLKLAEVAVAPVEVAVAYVDPVVVDSLEPNFPESAFAAPPVATELPEATDETSVAEAEPLGPIHHQYKI